MRKIPTPPPDPVDGGTSENLEAPRRPEPGDQNYVGRNHPPREHCYQKGQSGNPNGRPKGRHRFDTQLRKFLKKPVVLKDGRKITRAELAVRVLDSNLMKGELKAIDQLLLLEARCFGTDASREQVEITARRQQALREALQRQRLADDDPGPDAEEPDPSPHQEPEE